MIFDSSIENEYLLLFQSGALSAEQGVLKGRRATTCHLMDGHRKKPGNLWFPSFFFGVRNSLR
jgi:hypothetical protein